MSVRTIRCHGNCYEFLMDDGVLLKKHKMYKCVERFHSHWYSQRHTQSHTQSLLLYMYLCSPFLQASRVDQTIYICMYRRGQFNRCGFLAKYGTNELLHSGCLRFTAIHFFLHSRRCQCVCFTVSRLQRRRRLMKKALLYGESFSSIFFVQFLSLTLWHVSI